VIGLRSKPAATVALTALVFVLFLESLAFIRVPAANGQAAPFWVNDLQYGSPGGGFYWDPVSGQVWTPAREWHFFTPQPPRVPEPLWVNHLDYGSAGGGFYWDPTSGQVWTAERGWHRFGPGTQGSVPPGLVSCTVSAIVDGDTIDVSGCADAGRVRLLLIDAPETSKDCFAAEATAFVRSRLLGRTIGLERDATDRDQYGRFLRYVWLDGELFNEAMARDGYAKLLVFENVKYRQRLAAAEAGARDAQRGLWGACGVGNCAGPVAITRLDKAGEVVTISGSGDLTGWKLVSERGASSQRFSFPPGYALSGSVDVVSGVPRFNNTTVRLWWTASNIWNNSDDDDALLYDAGGQLVCEFDDGIDG
jgi:micrococcal nuclease